MSIFEDHALTQGQRLVWFAVQELATDGVAPDNCSQIAGHMGSGRAHVSRSLQTLERRGWVSRDGGIIHIHKEPSGRDSHTRNRDYDTQNRAPQTRGRDQETRNRDSKARDSESRKGFLAPPFVFPQERISFNPLSPSHLTLSQEDGKSSDSPPWWHGVIDPLWESEPLPDDHPVRWDHLPGDWTFDFAAAAMEHLRELELLASPVKRKIDREGGGPVVAEWADTFRLLHEQDDYSREEIKTTMRWLFEGRNFWINNQAIRSVPPLRSKTSNGDAYKFDVMYQQANSTDEQFSREDAKQRPEENFERLRRAAEAA